MKRKGLLFVILAGFLFVGCDDEAEKGRLTVDIWGEEYIEAGIPQAAFEDGWSVTFDQFLINVGAISVAEDKARPAFEDGLFRVFDLAAADGPISIGNISVLEGAYNHTSYTIAPTDGTAIVGNATQENLQFMVKDGYSVYVRGSATDGTATVTFAWGFKNRTVYDPCHSTGIVKGDKTGHVQITIHGDHLFYDDAVSEEPMLRFKTIALADADKDGIVTELELKSVDITKLSNYGVGSYNIKDLYGFIEHMTTTLGHIDGEGHCEF